MISRYEVEFPEREGVASPLDITPHWTWDNPLNVLVVFLIVLVAIGFIA